MERGFNRQIHVTSVVSASPKKEDLSQPQLIPTPNIEPVEDYTPLDPTVSPVVSASPVKETLSQLQLNSGSHKVSVEEYTPLDLTVSIHTPSPTKKSGPNSKKSPKNKNAGPAYESIGNQLSAPCKLSGQPLSTGPELVSPTVKEKINQIEGKVTSTPSTESDNFIRIDKRKSEHSPENAELSRKELKILKGEERKQDKLKRRLEYKQKNTIQINNSC